MTKEPRDVGASVREELKYGGLRLITTATSASARLRVVVDIGFGDAIEHGLEEIDLPGLLDFPPPHLRAYSRETVRSWRPRPELNRRPTA